MIPFVLSARTESVRKRASKYVRAMEGLPKDATAAEVAAKLAEGGIEKRAQEAAKRNPRRRKPQKTGHANSIAEAANDNAPAKKRRQKAVANDDAPHEKRHHKKEVANDDDPPKRRVSNTGAGGERPAILLKPTRRVLKRVAKLKFGALVTIAAEFLGNYPEPCFKAVRMKHRKAS